MSEEQKLLAAEKLSNRINAEGELFVKAQTYRTQLANKQEAVKKINHLVHDALKKKRLRIATKTPKAVKERRIENKKRVADVKGSRKKLKPKDIF